MAEDIDGALGIRATIDADDVKRGADEFIDALMRMQMQANNAAKSHLVRRFAYDVQIVEVR